MSDSLVVKTVEEFQEAPKKRASPFESKFHMSAAGRWPLGAMGSTLGLF
ncbi:MAG: hypothetical protein ACXWLB_13660 [Reyranella sp.]